MGDKEYGSYALVDASSDAESEYEYEESSEPQTPCIVRYKTCITGVFILIVFVIGVLFAMASEGWSPLTAMYVITQIITTIGYGDLVVQTDATRAFMTVYVLVCIVFVASVVSDIVQSVVDKETKAIKHHVKKMTSNFRDGNEKQEKTDMWTRLHLGALLASIAIFFAFALAGVIFFALYEDCACSYGVTKASNYPTCIDEGPTDNCATTGQQKTLIQTIYMVIITMTTVGFGDVTPLSRLGRSLGIIWMLLSVVASGNMVSCIGATLHAAAKEKKKRSMDSREIFQRCDSTGRDALDRGEFLEYFLIKNGMVKMEEINDIKELFDAKDKDNSGLIPWDHIEHHFAHDEE